MGASASSAAELKTAETSIRRLNAELKEAAAAVAAKESALRDLGAQLTQTQSTLQSTRTEASQSAAAAARSEEKLKSMRRDAELERFKKKNLEDELKRARDDLERHAGQHKFASARSHGEDAVKLVVEANAALAKVEDDVEVQEHPIFGQLVHDFGFKKLYVADASTLWTGTMLWERQRAFRDDRATVIADAKKASSVKGWPGAISVVESQADVASETASSSGVVVDGQHRLGAAWLLKQDDKPIDNLGRVLVEVYPPMASEKVFDLFAEINRAEPVALIDMPNENVDGGATESDRAIIDEAAASLKSLYPDMFKPSRNCRPPHLNVDSLRDEIHKANLLQVVSQSKDTTLEALLARQNAALAAIPNERWHEDAALRPRTTGSVLDTAIEKAQKYDCFLGLSWEWLYVDIATGQPLLKKDSSSAS